MAGRITNDLLPVSRLQSEIGDVFGHLIEDALASRGYAATYPGVNVREDGDTAYVEAELPGMTLNDIEVAVMGNQVTIKGEKRNCIMKNKLILSIPRSLAALLVCLAFSAVVHAEDPAATSSHSRSQTGAAARPEIERQRQEAEQQAKGTLDQEAIAAIRDTENAVKAIADGKTDEALAAIERATGKINVLVGRNPSAALLPVEAQVIAIDAAPTDVKAIRQIAKSAEVAVEDKDYPQARVLLHSLTSEIRVRTYNLPLGTYPASLSEAARLLDEKKTKEASNALMTALNTLVVIDRVTPLPLLVAQAAIDSAQAESSKDKNAAQAWLGAAKIELERAKELGYAGKDPEYAALNQSVSELENQLKGNEDTGSAFTKLKDRVKSFFHRLTGSEKSSVASR